MKLWNTLITECITLHATTLVHPLIFLGSLAIIFDTFLADIWLSFVICNNMLIFITFLEDSALFLDDLNHYLNPYIRGLAYRYTGGHVSWYSMFSEKCFCYFDHLSKRI